MCSGVVGPVSHAPTAKNHRRAPSGWGTMVTNEPAIAGGSARAWPRTREAHVAGDGWQPIERTRAYEQVIGRIEEQILAGALRVGDRLPAERDLSSMLGVSRAAVREAMRALEAMGVVSPGPGRDAGTVLTSMSSESLGAWLRLHVLLAKYPMDDVIEARVMLERRSAALAAAHADDERRSRLTQLAKAMEAPDLAREEFNSLDTEFHIAIAEAGGNGLVADLTSAIRTSMATPILDSFRRSDDWPGVHSRLVAGHRAILDAILARDEEAAAAAVDTHIRYAFGRLSWRAPAEGDTAR